MAEIGELESNMLCENITQLTPLKYPIYFVCKELDQFADFLDETNCSTDDYELFKRCVTGPHIWSVQSFVNLRNRGLDVRLVRDFVKGQICFIPYHYLTPRDMSYESFVVCTRTDCPRPSLCEMQTAMNRLALQPGDTCLTHWPQPFAIQRDSQRDATVTNVDFKGHPRNLISVFKTKEFDAALDAMGMRFLFNEEQFDRIERSGQQFLAWADYSKSDVLVAVRNLTEYDFGLKPALKLVNAWRAGVPALLGPEPAYRELYKSELDYIEVRSADEVLSALRKLKSDPELYRAMVANGFERAKDFTTDKVALEWHSFIEDKVLPQYEAWLSKPSVITRVSRPLRFGCRVIKHRINRKRHIHLRDHGFRPVSG